MWRLVELLSSPWAARIFQLGSAGCPRPAQATPTACPARLGPAFTRLPFSADFTFYVSGSTGPSNILSGERATLHLTVAIVRARLDSATALLATITQNWHAPRLAVHRSRLRATSPGLG